MGRVEVSNENLESIEMLFPEASDFNHMLTELLFEYKIMKGKYKEEREWKKELESLTQEEKKARNGEDKK